MEVALGALTSEITVADSQRYLKEKGEMERDLAEYFESQQNKMELDICAIQNEFAQKISLLLQSPFERRHCYDEKDEVSDL